MLICKYGDKCQFRHINEKCETKDCNISDCEIIHPKMCNYIKDFGRCKNTTYCRYDHGKPKYIVENCEKLLSLKRSWKIYIKIQMNKFLTV